MHNPTEHFIINNQESPLTMTDFWSWAYSDLTNNIYRSVLAEYIVSTAINAVQPYRVMWQPYDLLTESGARIEVKSAAYVQSWECRHPDHISFRIAPAQMPDPNDGYSDDAPKQRNCDIYVFCIYTALTASESPLNLDLWDFYVLPTEILDQEIPTQKTISLPSLLRFAPVKCQYGELKATIDNAFKAP